MFKYSMVGSFLSKTTVYCNFNLNIGVSAVKRLNYFVE